ncbi:hypothetical protein GCM10009733_076440 [Nonomuraea maheshkhaliensis]|uniref:Cytochrome d ubiquinol oxidase subunit II n=1 Tax=Nonomuraea maheshkhaliensis TaxID=419590 RepID=A0ABN2GA76_9ACTN
MSNGTRHALGVVAGLLLPPLVAAGLWYGVGELSVQAAQSYRLSWIGLGVLVATGILLAFLIASRLSPVASLLGGLAFTGVGVLPFAEMTISVRLIPNELLPTSLSSGFLTLSYSGLHLLLGVALLVASMFPSRWRARQRPEYVAQPEYAGAWEPAQSPAQSPYLPPQPPHQGPEDATRPMYRE